MERDCDVIVIGAGAAGLACAQTLVQAGRCVIVLEARDRIGGRVHTMRERGVVEAGAEFVHGEHATTWELIRAASLATEEWYVMERAFGKSGIRPDSLAIRAGVMRHLKALEYDARDGESAADAIVRQGGSSEEQFFARRSIGDLEGADPEDLDAKILASEDALATSGPKNFWITEGYDRVMAALAEGVDIRLEHIVTAVTYGTGTVRISCNNGAVFEATAVVITLPIGVLREGTVEFSPGLPAEFMQAVHDVGFGNTTKLTLWLREPLPSFGILDTEGSFGHFWQRLFGPEPVVVGFSGGSRADQLTEMGEEAAIAAGVAELSEALGVDIRPNLLAARHFTWSNDPFARGSYSYPALGMGTARQSLARPIDGIIFYTGEATNQHGHAATVHGAIEAGRDTADAVLATLGS